MGKILTSHESISGNKYFSPHLVYHDNAPQSTEYSRCLCHVQITAVSRSKELVNESYYLWPILRVVVLRSCLTLAVSGVAAVREE